MITKTICPKCKKENIKKDGIRKTENRGLIQRYKCKECGFRFVFDDGFKRMRNDPKKITCAIDLFYRGVSTRKIQEHFQAFYPRNSSHKSIYKWVVKYSKLISKFTDKLKLNVGIETQIDELEFHRRKSHKKGSKGIEKNFFIDSIDPTTKFMLASEYMKTKSARDIKAVMLRIKERTQKEDGKQQIKIMTTDGWNAYEKTIKKVFGYNLKEGRYNVFHNKVVVSEKDEVFNYPIERLHNSIRHRTKTFRGFHGSISSANAIMKGFEIYYNFITKHQAINCCPYELATNLKLNSENKWLELIKLSSSK
jgi:transposase-like protein